MADDFVDLEGEDKDSDSNSDSDAEGDNEFAAEEALKVEVEQMHKDGKSLAAIEAEKDPKRKLTKAEIARKKAIARLRKAAAALEDDDGKPSLKEMIRDYRILPGSRVYMVWEINIVFCVLWQAIAIPFVVGMELPPEEQWRFATWYNYVADIAFIVDLPIKFTMAYEDKYGTMHTSRKEIAQQYWGINIDEYYTKHENHPIRHIVGHAVAHWLLFPFYQMYTGSGMLVLDIIIAIPWDWFMTSECAIDGDYTKCDLLEDEDANRTCRRRACLFMVSTLKFFRLLRIGRLMHFLNKYQSQTLAKIFRLFAGFMLFAHWVGCLMWYVGVNYEPEVEGEKEGSWMRGQGLIEYEDSAGKKVKIPTNFRYLRSLYWALTTITSVGYGDMCPSTNKEIEFMILVEIGGAAFYAIIFSNMAVYVASLSAVHERYLEKIQSISEQMRHLDLSLHMQHKVEMYFEYLYLRHKALLDDDDYFFRELPTPLERQITTYLHSETVSGVHLFEGCTPEFVSELARRLKPLIVTPHQYIVHKGERATCIYFIRRGVVDVVEDSDGGEKLGELRTGEYFGEMAVLNDARRTCSVRAQGFCDLYIVSSSDLHDMLESFPNDQAQVLRNALKFFERKEIEPDKKDNARDAISDRTSARRISQRRKSARDSKKARDQHFGEN